MDNKKTMANERDELTGLLKIDVFWSKAEAKVKRNRKTQWCLIDIDIDHFKLFDQWFGRKTGDELLSKIGKELLNSEKKYSGVGGYFGQDDFIFLMPYNKEQISELFESLRSIIISVSSSVGFMPAFGVSLIEDYKDITAAHDRASIATTKAKKDIRNRISFYSPKMQKAVEKEFKILSNFMQALKRDEITFYLQPQCRISTGAIVGAEALVRWFKKGKLIPPNEFIPVLEKHGFIIDLDQYIWEKVCKWVRGWIDSGHTPIPVSVNVSRADIFTIDIAKHFKKLTAKYHIPHKLLKIEITESAYTETTDLIGDLVKELRNNGFMVLMDDFGSGYSSLNMLSNLKVDAIKLDANFLQIEEEEYKKGINILESVVNMAKQIALPIIVEGVENQEQSDFLEELGCRYVQGYHFYRPMPVDKLEELIADGSKIDERGFVVKANEQFRLREFLDETIYSDAMLNNIIGSVALYSWHDDVHLDIVRYNEQFYEGVDDVDFSDRLKNIERFMPKEDRPKMVAVLSSAIMNKLSGAYERLHFYKTDGSLTSYDMHFYHIGRKEGGEWFYCSAINVTEEADLRDEMALVAKYSHDNMIFVRKLFDSWHYTVASHGLSDVFGLSPKELEEELNNGKFKERVLDREGLKQFMIDLKPLAKKQARFEKEFDVLDKNGKKVRILLSFLPVARQTNNIDYIMITKII